MMNKRFKHAIVRKPARTFARGLSTAKPGRLSYNLTVKQHLEYVAALESRGIEVILLDALSDYPDAHFVEDTAVVTPDIAVIARLGAESRRGEADSIALVLERFRPTRRIEEPGTLDGGDVLMLGNHFLIGISRRTNPEGARQLGTILEDFGHTWSTIPVESGLHLKSALNYVGNNTLIATEEFDKLEVLEAYAIVAVDRAEAYAANTLWINDCLLTPSGFPQTRQKLEPLGIDIIELEVSEMRKMDGGLTCLSIRF
jgi:dimethylargininase